MYIHYGVWGLRYIVCPLHSISPPANDSQVLNHHFYVITLVMSWVLMGDSPGRTSTKRYNTQYREKKECSFGLGSWSLSLRRRALLLLLHHHHHHHHHSHSQRQDPHLSKIFGSLTQHILSTRSRGEKEKERKGSRNKNVESYKCMYMYIYLPIRVGRIYWDSFTLHNTEVRINAIQIKLLLYIVYWY